MLSRRYVFWPTRAEVMRLTPRAVRARVLSPDAAFDGGALPFAHLSADVRDLLASLLAREPEARPTALQALQHPWFAAQLPPDVPVAGPPPSLAHVLAHRSMANCATCTLTACPLSGRAGEGEGGAAPSPFDRVVDDASAVEVGGAAAPEVDG
jgi:serine/threonine protein kinase